MEETRIYDPGQHAAALRKPRVLPSEPDAVPESATPAERAIIEILSASLGELIVMNARLLNVLDELMRSRR